MASVWSVSAVTWVITVFGWVISSMLAGYFVPKIILYLSSGSDTLQKFIVLKDHKIPDWERTLQQVEVQRMLGGRKRDTELDDMAVKLRNALYEAEDIVDLVDYHLIEMEHGSRWYSVIVRFIRSGLARVQMLWKRITRTSNDDLPVTAVVAPPDDPEPVATGAARSLYQNNARTLLSLPTAISVSDLKKRIENVELIVIPLKNSPLLDIASNTAMNNTPLLDRASKSSSDKYRSKIGSTVQREVFGRELLCRDISAKLIEEPSSSSRTCYSFIGICGIAGSGKTTLARYVFDNINEFKYGHFGIRMRIHLSGTYSMDDLYHDMLENITKDQHSNISIRQDLKSKLEEALRGKRFLLVLDDLCPENNHYEELDELLSPLSVGRKGSKILVTSRYVDKVRHLCGDQTIEIPNLDKEVYFRMFMHYAQDIRGIHDETLETSGRKIADKLLLSPIAAATVAGQLQGNRDIKHWEATSRLDVLDGTTGALWWSYMQLDLNIRRCFEYCTLFPRGFELRREELVRLWTAQGFVKPSHGKDNMEDVAEGYIRKLMSCSFLQPEDRGKGTDYFKVHDLLHNLADKVVGSDCFRIENRTSQSQKENRTSQIKDLRKSDVRHLFVQEYDGQLITEEILRHENLRTLIIYNVGNPVVEGDVIGSIFKKLRKLRVLAIALSPEQYARLEKPNEISVPESIIQLQHIRYIALQTRKSCSVRLPSKPMKLYHMQLLDLRASGKSYFCAIGLVNLRHILCALDLKIPNISRMTSLQTMPPFSVGTEKEFKVKQLRDLNNLRGSLHVRCLENIESKMEALEANLDVKEWLKELKLVWVNSETRCSEAVEANVLEGLRPPVDLEELTVVKYKGSRYPDWMVGDQNGGPRGLKELILDRWTQVGPGPELHLSFPGLRLLELADCRWADLPENMKELKFLKILKIIRCLKIEKLPTLPGSLERFDLLGCNGNLTMSCQTGTGPDWDKIKDIPVRNIEARESPLFTFARRYVNQ